MICWRTEAILVTSVTLLPVWTLGLSLQFHALWVSVFLWQSRAPPPSTSSQLLHSSLDPIQWTTRGKKVCCSPTIHLFNFTLGRWIAEDPRKCGVKCEVVLMSGSLESWETLLYRAGEYPCPCSSTHSSSRPPDLDLHMYEFKLKRFHSFTVTSGWKTS